MVAPAPVTATSRAAVAGENDPTPVVFVGGTPAATLTVNGGVKKAAAQSTFVGADVTALKVELNAWYAKLQAAGIVT